MLIQRGMTGKEPVAKDHIPIASARKSTKRRMWQRRGTVQAAYKLQPQGQHHIRQTKRDAKEDKRGGRGSRGVRENRETGGCMSILRGAKASIHKQEWER